MKHRDTICRACMFTAEVFRFHCRIDVMMFILTRRRSIDSAVRESAVFGP